jgi:hypothetical protein
MTSPIFAIHNHEYSYEVLYPQGGWRGRGRSNRTDLFSTALCTQRARYRSCFGELFRNLKPLFFTGLKTAGKEAAKALGREALRTGSSILTDIADNPQAGYRDIIPKQVQYTLQNLGTGLMGRGRKRNSRSAPRRRNSKRPKRSVSRLRIPKCKVSSRKRVGLKAKRRNPPPIKRDIFS